MQKAVEVRNLSKKYEYYKKEPGFWGSLKSLLSRRKLYAEAFKDITFVIKPGELIGFLGPNGAGKTTTLKILSGILSPTEGEVRVLGFDPFKREKAYQKQFSLVMGQKNQLLNDLPAYESFELNKEIYEMDEISFKKCLDELTNLFEVDEFLHIPVRKLSLGQRMKCELIAALLHKPKILFLDEPTIGLDVVAQKKIRDFIKKYNQRKKTTIILTSHYMEDIKELCDRVIIMNLGRIIFDGRLNDLINKYATHKILKIRFFKKTKSESLKKYGEATSLSSFEVSLEVKRDEAKKVAAEILSSKLAVDDILIDEIPIDQIIREIFKC